MRRSNAKPPTDEEILAYDSVPPEVAARYIRMSTPTIYAGLQDDRIPFGFAVENKETHTWTYNISPGGLVKYKREGRSILSVPAIKSVVADAIEELLAAKLGTINRLLPAIADV